eukprot:373857-Prymnesium_polylepis.1
MLDFTPSLQYNVIAALSPRNESTLFEISRPFCARAAPRAPAAGPADPRGATRSSAASRLVRSPTATPQSRTTQDESRAGVAPTRASARAESLKRVRSPEP